MLSPNQRPSIDLYEDVLDVESVAVTMMLSFQTAGIQRSKLYAPQSDGLPADGDTPLS